MTPGQHAGEAILLRPARALLGWLADDQAFRLLASGQDNPTPLPDWRSAIDAARAAVEARGELPDSSGVLDEAPPELQEHEEMLRAAWPAVFAEGWTLRMVDLTRLCAMQPVVYTDYASQRASFIDSDDQDPRALAEITLPIVAASPLRTSFDEKRNAWVIVSANRNLRLVGRFTAPVPGAPVGGSPEGTPGFGFVVTVVPSHMQVVEFENRYYLRDGYHRALGALMTGTTRVPALVARFATVEQLAVAGGLPQSAYTGARPPLMTDYLSDDVAVTVQLPSAMRMVLVQGMELDFIP
jgi:hypothetical protein